MIQNTNSMFQKNENVHTSMYTILYTHAHISPAFVFCLFTQARCAVIAAANPIGGRYDPSLTFSDNVGYLPHCSLIILLLTLRLI